MKETKEDKEREQKWKAESDLRSLTEVNEIKADKPRYKRAMALAKEQMKALKNLNKEDT